MSDKRWIALLLALWLGACSEPAAPPQSLIKTVRVEIANPVTSYLTERSYSGRVEAGQTSDLSFELNGQVNALFVDEGDSVEQGQVLALLDTRLLEAEKRQLQSRVNEIEANLVLATANAQRQLAIIEKGLGSQQALDKAQADKASLTAALAQVNSSLVSNTIRLQQASLRAPFSGKIQRRHLDAGAVASSGQPILTLVENQRAEATFHLAVMDAESLKTGARLTVKIEDGSIVDAKLISKSPSIDKRTQTRAIRLALASQPLDGQWVELITQAKTVLATPAYWLPQDAISEGVRGSWRVFIYRQDESSGVGVVDHSAVYIEHASNDRFLLRGDLAGKKVIVGGTHNVVPGQQVKAITLTPIEGSNLED